MTDPKDPHVCPTCGCDATKLGILIDLLNAWDKARLDVTGEASGTEAQEDLFAWRENIHNLNL